MTEKPIKIEPWHRYTGSRKPRTQPFSVPTAPPWRRFDGKPTIDRNFDSDERSGRLLDLLRQGENYLVSQEEIDMVNAALYLRRPLMLTGGPGTGKSSLAYSVALELGLGPVLRWNITSHSTLRDGLYSYDAIGRLQESTPLSQPGPAEPARAKHESARNIGDYIRLGPLGTALLPTTRPRVVLIDEIDKSDIDLPNDLLNLFESGEFPIPELQRLGTKEPVHVFPADGDTKVPIRQGWVQCKEFPLIMLTSNAEREFSPAFLRRCLRLRIQNPEKPKLARILESHMPMTGPATPDENSREFATRSQIIELFLQRRMEGEMATDQLMNAVFMASGGLAAGDQDPQRQELIARLLQPLSSRDADAP